MTWSMHAARMFEMEDVYVNLVGKTDEKKKHLKT
jgi:hypothetical protein